MKCIYIKPETVEAACEIENVIATSTPSTPNTEWEMNTDGGNGTGIGDGTGKDPDADDDEEGNNSGTAKYYNGLNLDWTFDY